MLYRFGPRKLHDIADGEGGGWVKPPAADEAGDVGEQGDGVNNNDREIVGV